MNARTIQYLERELGAALGRLYPGRFSDRLQVRLLPDQGMCNHAFRVHDPQIDKDLVLRTRRASAEEQIAHSYGSHWSPYFKEAWAIQTAHLGVPVAEIDCNDTGYVYIPALTGEGLWLYAYFLQEYLPFETAAASVADSKRLEFFEQVGLIARQVNATSVSGFGNVFDRDVAGFSHPSWESFLAAEAERYIQELGRESLVVQACRRVLETSTIASEGTLYHLDFIRNWNNILVDEYGSISGIIDWEFAGAGPATHCELASTLYVYYRDAVGPVERRREFNALLAGYGLSLRAYAAHFRYDVESLIVKHALDALYKYRRLDRMQLLDSQPFRKVHAERAVKLIEQIMRRTRPRVYVRNPVRQISHLAA